MSSRPPGRRASAVGMSDVGTLTQQRVSHAPSKSSDYTSSSVIDALRRAGVDCDSVLIETELDSRHFDRMLQTSDDSITADTLSHLDELFQHCKHLWLKPPVSSAPTSTDGDNSPTSQQALQGMEGTDAALAVQDVAAERSVPTQSAVIDKLPGSDAEAPPSPSSSSAVTPDMQEVDTRGAADAQPAPEPTAGTLPQHTHPVDADRAHVGAGISISDGGSTLREGVSVDLPYTSRTHASSVYTPPNLVASSSHDLVTASSIRKGLDASVSEATTSDRSATGEASWMHLPAEDLGNSAAQSQSVRSAASDRLQSHPFPLPPSSMGDQSMSGQRGFVQPVNHHRPSSAASSAAFAALSRSGSSGAHRAASPALSPPASVSEGAVAGYGTLSGGIVGSDDLAASCTTIMGAVASQFDVQLTQVSDEESKLQPPVASLCAESSQASASIRATETRESASARGTDTRESAQSLDAMFARAVSPGGGGAGLDVNTLSDSPLGGGRRGSSQGHSFSAVTPEFSGRSTSGDMFPDVARGTAAELGPDTATDIARCPSISPGDQRRSSSGFETLDEMLLPSFPDTAPDVMPTFSDFGPGEEAGKSTPRVATPNRVHSTTPPTLLAMSSSSTAPSTTPRTTYSHPASNISTTTSPVPSNASERHTPAFVSPHLGPFSQSASTPKDTSSKTTDSVSFVLDSNSIPAGGPTDAPSPDSSGNHTNASVHLSTHLPSSAVMPPTAALEPIPSIDTPKSAGDHSPDSDNSGPYISSGSPQPPAPSPPTPAAAGRHATVVPTPLDADTSIAPSGDSQHNMGSLLVGGSGNMHAAAAAATASESALFTRLNASPMIPESSPVPSPGDSSTLPGQGVQTSEAGHNGTAADARASALDDASATESILEARRSQMWGEKRGSSILKEGHSVPGLPLSSKGVTGSNFNNGGGAVSERSGRSQNFTPPPTFSRSLSAQSESVQEARNAMLQTVGPGSVGLQGRRAHMEVAGSKSRGPSPSKWLCCFGAGDATMQ